MAGLPRDIIKWIQSLNLSAPIRNPKWDFSNGYLIAEIFTWYFPAEIGMHSFNKGQSIDLKLRNWDLLKNFIARHNLSVPEDSIEGTIHCKEGGAHLLIKSIYEALTNRRISMPSVDGIDYTDQYYQKSLPIHARSNAAKQLKNNISTTEVIAHPNKTFNEQKAEVLLLKYKEMRQMMREEDPARFGIQPSIGQLCARRAPRQPTYFTQTETSLLPRSDEMIEDEPQEEGHQMHSLPNSNENITEIVVHQTPKNGNYQPVVIG